MVDTVRQKKLKKEIKDITKERVKHVRLSLGLKHKDIADSVICARSNVYLYEGGDRMLSIEYLYMLYQVYGINPNWVLGIEENMYVEGHKSKAFGVTAKQV